MKIEQKYSIINDIIGPVMTGPSSSHTAGPSRIGYMARQLMNGDIDSINIEFVEGGSFAASYDFQGTDRGLIGGLMGFMPDDERLISALDIAQSKQISYTFAVKKFDAPHPNTARLILKNSFENTLVVTGISTGGGIVEIIKIDDFDVSIKGDYYETLLFFRDNESSSEALKKDIDRIVKDYEYISISKSKEDLLVDVKTTVELNVDIFDELKKNHPALTIRKTCPVYSVLSGKDIKVPFDTAEEMLGFSEKNNNSPGEAGLAYEMARGNMSKDDVMSEMEKIANIMECSIERGLKSDKPGKLIKPFSGEYLKKVNNGELIDLGVMDTVIAWTMAMVEVNSYYGIVVAAPTSGACGTVPGAVLGVAKHLKSTPEEKALALLAAGATGIAIANQATFAAEICGCQAECGSASAMAAAGIIQLMGGTSKQANAAASISLQNVLGMICDSVANLVEVPCLGRNVMCAINAVSSANMVLAGVEEIIPLDEVIVSMLEVGNLMPPELCCTNSGGLAVTKTSKELERKLK